MDGAPKPDSIHHAEAPIAKRRPARNGSKATPDGMPAIAEAGRPEWFKQDPSSSPAPAAETPVDHRGNAQSVAQAMPRPAAAPAAEPLRAGLFTPPRGRSAGLPDEPVSPGPGSGTEELRQWCIKMFTRVDDRVNLIIHQQASQKGLGPGKDLSEIMGRIKAVEKHVIERPTFVKDINELQDGLRASTANHFDVDARPQAL